MYYIVFAIGIALALVNDKKNISFHVFTLVLLLFAIFRYRVGADYLSYQYLYGIMHPTLAEEIALGVQSVDVGFRIFGFLLKSCGVSYQVYVSIIGAINIFFVSRICKEHSKNPTLSLLIYFSFYYLVWTWSALRQGMAMAIGLYFLLRYMNQNKHIRFFVIVAALSFIHASALILIPMYFAARISFTRKSLIIVVVCSIVFAFLPIGTLLQKFDSLPLIHKVLNYMDKGSLVSRLVDFKTIARLAFLIVALFYYSAYAKQGASSQKIMNVYIIGMAIYFVFQVSETAAARLGIYGKVLDIIILTNVYYLYKERINKVIYALVLAVLMVLYLNKEITTMKQQTGIVLDDAKMMPYTHIFDKRNYEYNNIYYDVIINDVSGRY